MNSKRVKSNKAGALLGALLLLALIPNAGYAAAFLTYYFDIVTNWPGSDYVTERNRIQTTLPSGAKWGIDSYDTGVTNNHGYTHPAIPEGWWTINFRTMTNYYVPISSNINLTADTNYTYYYIPYTNSLSVTITGTNGVSPVLWSVASPSEWINSSAYQASSYTNNYALTPIPTGSYTVTFPAMAGLTTPDPVTTNITWGSPSVNPIVGAYTAGAVTSSALTVWFEPSAVRATATWWVYNATYLSPHGPFWHNATTNLAISNDYTISYGPVRGYYLAASTNLTNFFGDRILTNTFLPYSNNLAVTIAGVTTPTNVIWTLAGPGEFTNAVSYATTFTNTFPGATPNTRTIASIPTGSYAATFPALVGYALSSDNPLSTNIVNASPTVNNLTGTYARLLSTIQVTVSPSNGSWAFTAYPSDFTNYSSSALSGTNNATLTNAPVGSYTIEFLQTMGYDLPTPSTVTKTSSQYLTTTFEGIYDAGWRLTVHVMTSADTNLAGLGSGSFTVLPADAGFSDGNESWYFSRSINPEITILGIPATNTSYTNFFYKWTGDIGEMSPNQNPIVVTMDADRVIQLYFSRAWSTNDQVGDIDQDGLPDAWELANGLNPESDKGNDGASGNEDFDFIPSASTNAPWTVLVVTNLISYSGQSGVAGYPLLRNRLLSRGQAYYLPESLGYANGVPFNNFLECRGLDGWYRNNTPPGLVYASAYGDDPMTDPKDPDTDGDEMTDGWEYYFWVWRSANARAAGVTNSANLDWVLISPSIPRYNSSHDSSSDTDLDNMLDITEFQNGTDPTHCDTDADGMDDVWEINTITPLSASNALDSANALFNPDGDYMAWVNQGMLTTGTVGTALGTNVCWSGGVASNPSTAWNDVSNTVFNLYHDTILKASVALTNGTTGTRYAFTNYYGTNAGLASYKDGYPVWVDADNSGSYTTNDYVIVNPLIKHDAVYRMAPTLPGPGVCSFDPRTAWTNVFPGLFSAVVAAPNTQPYNNYQEYLGGDYIGRLSWDAGGRMTAQNDPDVPTSRNSYTLPNNQDTDADLMPDGWELYTGLNPNSVSDASADPDSDALNNLGEWANATHPLGTCIADWPNKPWPTDPGVIVAPDPNDPHPQDTDWDGLVDGYALITTTYAASTTTTTTNNGEYPWRSNPTQVDTDEDMLPDGWEVYAGTDPLVSDANLDSDFDGLRNWQEYWTGTVDEWMLCDPDWNLYFLARRLMDWDNVNNPRLGGAGATDALETFGGTDLVDMRWFIPPDFLTCPSFLYYNGVVTNLAWLRSTNGFPASASLWCDAYHTTFAGSTNNIVGSDPTDSDYDGMDDFWEIYHCLNPIRGLIDLNFGMWDMDRASGSMMVGSTDADPSDPSSGNQVGTQGSPFNQPLDLVNYWKALRAIDATTVGGAAAQEAAVIAIVGPHNFGLLGMDPDGDGLVNSKELQVHTAPSPFWRTDRYASSPYNFVMQNFTRDNTFRAGGFNLLGFTGISYDGDGPAPPYRWADGTEGFDTDNDLISDYDELTGYRETGGAVAGTDPLNDESPLRNRVLWLDGTNSWACSAHWQLFGGFTKFSVEAWVRPSRLSSAADQVAVVKTSSYIVQRPDGSFTTTALSNFELGLDTAGMPYVLFHGFQGFTTNRATASRVGILQVGTWAHLAGVFDGSSLTLYVNGEVSATHRTTDVPAHGTEQIVAYIWTPNNISIGAREIVAGEGRNGWLPAAANKFFAGCIDEVRVWDRVITAGEIISRKDRRLTPDEVGTVLGGNDPFAQGANNLFAYYRFTDLPDPNVEGKAPSGFPTDRPALAVNYSLVYTNYLVMASDRVKRIPRLPPLDTRVIDGAPVATNGTPDGYGISTTNYLAIQLPAGFRNSANPYNFLMGYNHTFINGMWLLGNAQGLRTNIWLGTLDPDDPDSTDSDGDGLPDWWEQKYGLDPDDATGDNGAWGDPDHDGLNNRAEYLAGTNPLNSDTDGDGIGDYDSPRGVYSRTYGEMYTDGDGMPDDWESENGLDPQKYDANLDLDGDGWSNYAEYQAGTDPNNKYEYPQPLVFGVANYYGSRTGMLRFYAYEVNTMDGVPQITKVGTDSQVAEVVGQANGTFTFTGRLPIAPIDATTVVRISAPVSTNNMFVTFTFTGPETYTYEGEGLDYAANLSYVNGRFTIRWASVAVPLVGANVTVEYNYVNRNSAAFSLSGFKEGDFYMMTLLDNGNASFDANEPMGIMDDQPVYLSYSSISGIRVLLTDTRPGFGRFAWTAASATTPTNAYPVVINKLSESGAPTILQRSMAAPRNYFHEWDFQLAGIEGLMAGTYQWWMGSQNGTFNVNWPSSLAKPVLVYPRGDVLYYAQNQFAWTMDLNCPRAHFQVARGAADGALVTDKYVRAPWMDEQNIFRGWLDDYASDWGNGAYYWRVAGWTPQGESAWSDWQTFNVNLSATNSRWVTGDIYYFGKAPATKIIVEAFDNRGFGGRPVARMTLTPPAVAGWEKCSYTLRGLEQGAYYVRAFLDVTPAGGAGANNQPDTWESVGFYLDPNNFYQAGLINLSDVQFMDNARIIIRDKDTDNDKLPDAWEMAYFGNLDQTGDMDYDGDGETNLDEYIKDGVNQNPAMWDSDGDGLSDGFESHYNGAAFGFARSAKAVKTVLNPAVRDTDSDGYSDGAELLRYHTDPLDPTDYPRYLPLCTDAWPSPGDYDGDGRSDVGVYDFNAGVWSVITMAGQSDALPFGFNGAQPMVGDYTGDGRSEFAFYDKGIWTIHTYGGQSVTLKLGDASMLPAPADYTGNGRVDLAVFDTDDGTWYIYDVWSGAMFPVQFGASGMIPVPGDYNGDGAADLALYEPATGNWMLGCYHKYYRTWTAYGGTLGGPTWIPVPGDYDGDGRNDACLFESNTGRWMLFTLAGQFFEGTFGWKGCVPVPGDYDGDGRTDVAIYDTNTGMWYILCMGGAYYEGHFGWPGALPITKGR